MIATAKINLISLSSPHTNELYFTASNGTTGRELWKIHPVTKQPVLVKDLDPLGGHYSHSNPEHFYIYNDSLYIYADTQNRSYLRKLTSCK